MLAVELLNDQGLTLCTTPNVSCYIPTPGSPNVPVIQRSFAVNDRVFNISTVVSQDGNTGDPINLAIPDVWAHTDFITLNFKVGSTAVAMYVYSDGLNVTPGRGARSFFRPYDGVEDTPDVVFRVTGSGGGPSGVRVESRLAHDPSTFESTLGNRFVFPYDRPTRSGAFLARVGTVPTATQRVFTFSSTHDLLISTSWDPVWNLPGLVAQFGPGRRLVIAGSLDVQGATLTAADPVLGWRGVQVAGSTSRLRAGTVIRGVVSNEGALYVATSIDFRGTRGAAEGPKARAHVILDGVRIDSTRGGGAGLVVIGYDASASLVGTTLIIDNTTGPGVQVWPGGEVAVESNDVRIMGNAGGIFATGAGAHVLVLEGEVSDNTGPGLHASSGGRIDVLRDDGSGTTSLTSNDPVHVLRNAGGLYAEETGKQGGAVISSGDAVCVQEPCTSIGGHDFSFNTQPSPSGDPVYDALARGASQVLASNNYWDGRTTAQVRSTSRADSSSFVDVSNAVLSPPSAGGPAGNRSFTPTVSGARLDAVAASRGRVDAAVQELLSQADGLVRSGDSTFAAARIVAAATIVTSEHDRFAVSEAAGRALATVWPPVLVAWAEAEAVSPAGRAWGRRALAVGHAGHARTSEARVLAQALVAEDGAGSDSMADGHRARGLGLLVDAAITDDDGAAAIAALSALADVDPEGAAERAVQVALAFPSMTISFARAPVVPRSITQASASAGKASPANALEGASLTAGPNPASGSVRVVLTLTSVADARVAVLDALGREVAVLHDGPAAANVTVTFDGAAQPAGVYVVRAVVRSADGTAAVLARRVSVVR